MFHSRIDAVNVTTTDVADDLILCQGGATYILGESDLDRDTFAADFRGQAAAIDLRVTRDDAEERLLANGVLVQGIDRLVLLAGKGADSIHGGELDDLVDGGGGSDRPFGGEGDDINRGGDGDDVIYRSVDGGDLYFRRKRRGRGPVRRQFRRHRDRLFLRRDLRLARRSGRGGRRHAAIGWRRDGQGRGAAGRGRR